MLIGALLLLGIALLLIEVVLIPGFGFVGISGFAALSAGCYLAYFSWGATAGLSLALASIAFSLLLIWWFPRSRTAQNMVLSSALPTANQRPDAVLTALPEIGVMGITESHLRPVGTVLFAQCPFEASSRGEFIAAGVQIQVIAHEQGRIFVRVFS